MDKIICDASSLIVLAKADLLELLQNQFSEIFVPQAVLEEILAGPFDDPMRGLISKIEWLEHVRIDPPLSPIGSWQLGRGESEVIEYARLHLYLYEKDGQKHYYNHLLIQRYSPLRFIISQEQPLDVRDS